MLAISRFFYDLIFPCVIVFLAVSRRLLCIFRRPQEYLLISTPYPGVNRGDEALLRVSANELKSRIRDVNNITIVATGVNGLVAFEAELGIRVVHKYAGLFISQDARLDLLMFLLRFFFVREVVFVGADLVDEGYGISRSYSTLSLLDKLAKIGVPARLISFSVDTLPSETLSQRFYDIGDFVRFFPRDPISKNRLMHCRVRYVTQACDLAYLLEPNELSPQDPIAVFLNNTSKMTIGVNFISKVVKPRDRFERLCTSLAKALIRLIKNDGYQVLLFPHDSVEDFPDLQFLYSCMMREGASTADVYIFESVPDAATAKAIAALCFHVFTCRLHLAIAALGSGRAVTCFPYKGKFEGQVELIGLGQDVLISPEAIPDDCHAIYSLLSGRLQSTVLDSERIMQNLPSILHGSRLNFSEIGP